MHFSKLLEGRKSAITMRPVSIESTLLLFLLIQNFLGNNNLKVIGEHYLNCVKELNFIHRVTGADRVSKNVVICGMHSFFRRNETDDQSKRMVLIGIQRRIK